MYVHGMEDWHNWSNTLCCSLYHKSHLACLSFSSVWTLTGTSWLAWRLGIVGVTENLKKSNIATLNSSEYPWINSIAGKSLELVELPNLSACLSDENSKVWKLSSRPNKKLQNTERSMGFHTVHKIGADTTRKGSLTSRKIRLLC